MYLTLEANLSDSIIENIEHGIRIAKLLGLTVVFEGNDTTFMCRPGSDAAKMQDQYLQGVKIVTG